VNSFTQSVQSRPAIDSDGDGDYVIVWVGPDRTATDFKSHIHAQRFSAAGAKRGTEFEVNTVISEDQNYPSVAMDAAGNFVVAWERFHLLFDFHGKGVYVRRFDASGVALGAEQFASEAADTSGTYARVAGGASGNFVVTWHSNFAGPDDEIYANVLDLNHTPTVVALAANPDPAISGNSFTLTASDVTDHDPIASVSFYRESNGTAGLQIGALGDTFLATDTSGPAGVFDASVSTAGLAPGGYTYWAQARDAAGLIGAPGSTVGAVTGGPVVSASGFLYQTPPHRLRFTFSQDVRASLAAADLSVERLGTGGGPVTFLEPAYDTATNTATFAFGGTGVLPSGLYRATLVAAGVTNAGGTPLAANVVLEFSIQAGDINSDRRVDGSDFAVLAGNFGKSGMTYAQGDLNGDGFVNGSDFAILAGNFGKSVPPPAAMAASAAPVKVAAATTAGAASVTQSPKVPAPASRRALRRRRVDLGVLR
jgi:hypothetical protein